MKTTLYNGAHLTDLMQICYALPEDEREQYEALFGWPYDPEHCAFHFRSQPGQKWTLVAEDRAPLCAAGFIELRKGVYQDWMLTTPRAWAADCWRSTTKNVKHVMDAMLAGPAHRLQCVSLASRIHAHKWYSVLGLEPEFTLHAYGANGENAIMFYRLRKEHGFEQQHGSS